MHFTSGLHRVYKAGFMTMHMTSGQTMNATSLRNMTLKNRSNAAAAAEKDLSNPENFQWKYKGLTFLDNNSRNISV